MIGLRVSARRFSAATRIDVSNALLKDTACHIKTFSPPPQQRQLALIPLGVQADHKKDDRSKGGRGLQLCAVVAVIVRRAFTATHCTAILPSVSSSRLQPHPNMKTVVFGANMTDHMLEIDWTTEKGWHTPTITPYHPLSIDPAASVFQYAVEAFEGMKAYRRDDGAVALFRPDLNMARLTNSMTRLAGPQLDGAGLLEAIKAFVRVERDWVPAGEGNSLYLRPTFISTWPMLGVMPARSFKVYVIACPVGPYYPEGARGAAGLGSGGYRISAQWQCDRLGAAFFILDDSEIAIHCTFWLFLVLRSPAAVNTT